MSLFLLQLRGELWKLFARKRTYIGFGVFLGVETLFLVLCQIPFGQRGLRRLVEQYGGVFEQYFSGLTVAMIMLTMTLFFLGALFLGLVGGDLIAKEVEDGTMRMTLCRPVSRLRVLRVKYATCVIYTFTLVIFVGLSALGAAMLMRGAGGLFLVIMHEKLPVFYDFGPGLVRYLASLLFFALSLLTIATFSFTLSCCNMKPATATISAVALFFVDWIVFFFPILEAYRPWTMHQYMSTWLNVFRNPLPWPQMLEDYGYLIGLDATFFVIGAIIFSTRDFKS
ncbi:MAG: ABC transporter permease [Chthoniobacter sp.]|nr:ABC transporter permease [Chthoniobacter sp.]